jgi:L-2-hydroxyglutarate oxidase LhgO
LPLERAHDTGTTQEVLASVQANGVSMVPALAQMPAVASYAGNRCHCEQGSYTIHHNDVRRNVTTVTGIRSTGFTAAATLA